MTKLVRLGVNIDHVATLRNARGGVLPEPLRAAKTAIEAGASSITVHLREDRRHIRDADVARLLAELSCPLNLEIAVTDEMVDIACRLKPHAVCLVPEKREERTTEGGLNIVDMEEKLKPVIERLSSAGTRVSLFVEADAVALEMAVKLGAPVVELHTGAWCEAHYAGDTSRYITELERLNTALALGAEMGLEMHAGHGLDYATAEVMCAHPAVTELNIGHFLIGESVFVGLDKSVKTMLSAMQRGRGTLSS